jgi:HEAT repeats
MRTAICLMSLALASPALAAQLTLPRDGWSSWEVETVDDAPAWCCWSNGGDERHGSWTSCKLDSDSGGFGSRDDATTDTMKIYARTTDGRVDRLRVLSATCPAQAATPIHDLGAVAQDDSVRWLTDLAKQVDQGTVKRNRVGDNVLAALAVHRGNLARDALAGMARNDARRQTRKQAVFWLAQARGNEGADITSSVMFNDQDPDVREHAIFALSQLPDERGTQALIAAAEDRSLSREQRKRAVFWLAQSQSDSAQAYLERVLTAHY